MNEDLRKWVQEKWVDIGAPKKGGGFKPCGRSKGEKRKGYPKCVPASKAASMSKGQRRSAVKRKRSAGNAGPKPTNVSTFTKKNKMKKENLSPTAQLIYEKLCAKGKAAAKRKFKVYPSAYANMYASAVCSGKVTPGGKKSKKNESAGMTGTQFLTRKARISSATRSVARTNPKLALKKGARAHTKHLAMRRKRTGRDSNIPGSFDSPPSTSEVRTHTRQRMLDRNTRISAAATAARRASIKTKNSQITPNPDGAPRPRSVKQINTAADKAFGKNKAMRTSGPENASLSRSDAPRLDEKGKMPKMKMGVHKSRAGGLTAKGVKAYRAKNPGSKLKTAVTTKPSKLKKGSKAASRRKSFCSRMGGMKKRLTSKKTANDPNSRINKALRKWNC
jgi:hypothetical protein